jgi:hypothetical protein
VQLEGAIRRGLGVLDHHVKAVASGVVKIDSAPWRSSVRATAPKIRYANTGSWRLCPFAEPLNITEQQHAEHAVSEHFRPPRAPGGSQFRIDGVAFRRQVVGWKPERMPEPNIYRLAGRT